MKNVVIEFQFAVWKIPYLVYYFLKQICHNPETGFKLVREVVSWNSDLKKELLKKINKFQLTRINILAS